MAHLTGLDRSQLLLLPETVDDYVGPDNPVRFIEAFVDQLDFQGAGFARVLAKATGRPGYDPADLLKLYIYGYLNRVRSRRRLEAEAHRNIEVIWLLRHLKPDFKTIADFRRDNRAAFKAVFREFVVQALREDLRGDAEIARPVLHDPLLADRFAELFADLTAPIPDALAAAEGVLRTLAHLLIRHGSRPLASSSPPPPVTLALRRLTDAPEQPTTLAELAALSGVSRFQLLRGFARVVGVTPHAYLLQQRVRLAQRLLAAGRRPADAAAEAGFADQSHLTRAFRHQLGVTPARYRAAVA